MPQGVGEGGMRAESKRVMEKVEREKRGDTRKGGGEFVKTKNESPVMSRASP